MTKPEIGLAPDPRDGSPEAVQPGATGDRRKPMIKPELTRHGSLPEVTGAFIGTFSP